MDKKGQGVTFDTWTITHIAWGMIAKYFDISLLNINILSILHELTEAYFRKIRFLGVWGEPETLPNVIVDHASVSLGWEIANILQKLF